MVWLYSGLAVLLFVLLTGIFSSCAVVKTNFSEDAKKDATVYYYLPESIIKIHSVVKVAVIYNSDSTLNGSSRVIEQSFTTTSEMIADTKELLALNYKPNALMADEIKLAVNAKGLLETVNITTEDRTPEIIATLAAAPQTILGINSGQAKAADIIIKIKEYTTDFALKASDISTTKKLIGWNLIVLNELGENDFLNIAADFEINTVEAAPAPKTVSELMNNNDKSVSETNGILTRPIKNLQLNIESKISTLSKALPVTIQVADAGKLLNIPVNRTAFVKRINKIGFSDGMLISNEINKPSSVEGFVSIPINIAKAVVSIPGQLVTFKIDNTKRLADLENQKLALEKSVQESQKFELTKNHEIEKIKLDLQKTALSNDIELQKTKLDLEKSLLEAELSRLKTEKELEALKKEIEELKAKK